MRQSISRAASRVRTDIAFAVIDVLVVTVSYAVALAFRMVDPMVGEVHKFWLDLLLALPLIVLVHVVANAVAGAYGHVWEYASTTEAARLALANAGATAFILSSSWVVRDRIDVVVPFLTLVTGGLLSLLMMGLVRYRSRLFSFRKLTEGRRIVIVGKGAEAATFARRASEIDGGSVVVGFVDDQGMESRPGRLLAELPVLGSIVDLPRVIENYKIDEVLVAGKDPDLIRTVVDESLEVDVRLRILPGVEDIMADRHAPLDVRDIRVEDLLVRDQVATDMASVEKLLDGKRVLVTGGGGSIGSEIVRQIVAYSPAAVWALDRDETLLHEARLSWGEGANIVLADVRDSLAVLRAIERIKPDVIFHAAALKHVPVLEDYPEEAVLTNVIGTRNVIEAGSRVGAERMVLISTDKAVDPTSVMGASKRVAELLIKAGNARRDGCTYTAVRFGNVLGSRGSVIPTFVSQIRAGGPVTVTDPDMTRYFMTVNEAVQLVLQAGAMARGSEVFLLDMGEPVRIQDLARRLIRLAGLIPDVDIEIQYTGVRPGEKLCESLSNGPVDVTPNPKIFEVPLSHPEPQVLAEVVADLEEAALSGEGDRVVALLGSLAQGRLWSHREESPLMSAELGTQWS